MPLVESSLVTKVALAISVLFGGACGPDSEDDAGDATRVVDVVDGDTLVVVDGGDEERVRIIGINSPETGECVADAATDSLAALTAGEEVVLVADTSDVDQFDRLLRYVELKDGTDVGAELVRNGLAIARRYEPDTDRHERYVELQGEARVDGLGLWAPDACGDAVASDVSLRIEINADAPGDDTENLNGEWVRMVNEGDEDVDLSEWTIADESASNRYSIAAGTTIPAGSSITVFSGCGDDTTSERYWCSAGSAIWNNDGDTAFLRDPNGNLVVAERYEP